MLDYAKILTQGVGGWLQFERACGRVELFSEKYLAQPIGQILSGQSNNRARAEYRHPILGPLATGPGRRPEVDFVVCDPYPKISIAVESKWIGKTKPSVQSIIWDLIRLELLAYHEYARCFFLLGGKKADLEKFFAQPTFSDAKSTPARPVLRHDNNVRSRTNLVPIDKVRIPLLKALFEDYQDQEFPHRIISRRAAPFPDGPTRDSFQIYTWEISSAGRRDAFRPRNSKHYVMS
ncbi:hypothetical protein [Rhodopila globiformis]|uniref:hypothetical protein n=1 Tax=Rhodopila globiformis TaxID=1071 RepID=UPI0011B0C869|nr:hypothetical protein [Rhodopila globiformis]